MSHDVASCPVCAPVMATEAYRRGVARALAVLGRDDAREAPPLVPLDELVAGR